MFPVVVETGVDGRVIWTNGEAAQRLGAGRMGGGAENLQLPASVSNRRIGTPRGSMRLHSVVTHKNSVIVHIRG